MLICKVMHRRSHQSLPPASQLADLLRVEARPLPGWRTRQCRQGLGDGSRSPLPCFPTLRGRHEPPRVGILYASQRHPWIAAERAYAQWLIAKRSCAPAGTADHAGKRPIRWQITVSSASPWQYELSYTNLLTMLDWPASRGGPQRGTSTTAGGGRGPCA